MLKIFIIREFYLITRKRLVYSYSSMFAHRWKRITILGVNFKEIWKFAGANYLTFVVTCLQLHYTIILLLVNTSMTFKCSIYAVLKHKIREMEQKCSSLDPIYFLQLVIPAVEIRNKFLLTINIKKKDHLIKCIVNRACNMHFCYLLIT